jgi:hypothetical protein
MTFLALTPFQATLLALFIAGTVIALYFLKLRHRKVTVPSSLVWRLVLDEHLTHSFREKLRKIFSIAIAVTIALLIAMSLGRPDVPSLTGKAERIVIVLDTSPTMNTRTADGKTRWQHAVEKAQALLDTGGVATEFRITDTSGLTESGFTSDRRDLPRLLQQMSPRTAQPHFPRLDESDTKVYFISDGIALHDAPAFVKQISVFESANNVGITAFEVRSTPSAPLGYEAYLEVRNYGKPTNVSVTLTGTSEQKITRTAHLAADESFKDVFDLSQFPGGQVRASILAEDDALPIDDIAFGYLPVKPKTRTLLVTHGNSNLEKLLSLDKQVELLTVRPEEFRESSSVDVYIFDRFAPSAPPSKPALIIGAEGVSWLKQANGVVQHPEITTWSEDHPLMQYVSIHDVSIERATRIDAANLTVIAASNQTPLIVASEKPKWVMLTFDLGSSDFQFHSAFPVFIENVLGWLSREPLALRLPPGLVEVPLANAQIQNSDGKTIPSEQQLGKTVFQADEPGVYAATQGDARLHVAVNLTNPALSDINRSTFKNEKITAGPRYWLGRELWFYMLLAAVTLITIEWFTYHRRITL